MTRPEQAERWRKQQEKRARAERQARETAVLDLAIAGIGPSGCPFCFCALFSAWNYKLDCPAVDADHDCGCPGPSGGWHGRVATDWLLAMLDAHGFKIAEYDLDGGIKALTRHRAARAPA